MTSKNSISQRISLEGGDEINRQLEAMGKAGERAFAAIKAAAEKSSPAITNRFQAAITNIKQGFSQLRDSASRVQTAVAGLQTRFAAFGSSLGTVATRLGLVTTAALGVVAALFKIGTSAIEAVDEADTLAQSLGLSIEKLSGLQGAAAQANVESATFATALTSLNRSIVETAQTAGQGAREVVKFGDAEIVVRRGAQGIKTALDDNASAFAKLGVSTRNADGSLRDTDAVLLDIADKFRAMPDGARKSALAVDFFGKAGARMIPFLNEGSKGIKAIIEDARKMGTVLTEQDKKLAQLADQGIDRFNEAVRGARIQLGLLFAPAIAAGSNFLANLWQEHMEAIKKFGRTIIDHGIVLIFDFIQAWNGFDEDVDNKWILDIRDGLVAIGESARIAIFDVILPAFSQVREGAEFVASQLNGMFNTEFTGSGILAAAMVLKISGAFGLLGTGIRLVVSAINLGLTAFRLLAPAILLVGPALSAIGTGIATVVAAIAGVIGLPVAVTAGIIAAIAAAAVAIFIYWDEIVAYASEAWERIKTAASEAKNFIVNQFSDPDSFTRKAFDAWRQGWIDFFAEVKGLAFEFAEYLKDTVVGAINSVIDTINEWIGAAKEAIGLSSKAPAAGGGGSGFARGGPVRGAGSSTSDSIPAWLSNGEFVVRTESVKKYGVGLFHLLNAGRLSLKAVSDLLSGGGLRLNLGGLVTSMPSFAMPRFAEGGPVSLRAAGGDTLVLDLGGLRVPLKGERGAVAEVARYFLARRSASGGSSPYT